MPDIVDFAFRQLPPGEITAFQQCHYTRAQHGCDELLWARWVRVRRVVMSKEVRVEVVQVVNIEQCIHCLCQTATCVPFHLTRRA